MFGWLKKKAANEQKKLLFQVSGASQYLKSDFELHSNAAIAARMQHMEDENRRIWLLATAGEKLPPTDLQLLLSMNKELRSLFRQSTLGRFHQFDNQFKPILGWEEYYRNTPPISN